MKEIKGNILDVDYGIICQQVNCQGVMGCGIAKQIRNKWPEVYKRYKMYHKNGFLRLGKVVLVKVTNNLLVANLCGQDRYGRDKRYTNYLAIETCLSSLVQLNRMNRVPVYTSLPVYIPYNMGCANAGGDWKLVSAIIEKIMPSAIIVRL